MVADLLKKYKCFLNDYEEQACWQGVIKAFEGSESISYMPSIILDLWPVHVLECTRAAQLFNGGSVERLYLLPMGNKYGREQFSKMISDWYKSDLSPDGGRNSYGAELSETVLLKGENSSIYFPVDGIGNVSAIYLRFRMKNGKAVHLLAVAEAAHDFWRTLESCNIKCDFLIHSNKGLGDWFNNVPLSKTLTESKFKELLPKYYLQGKFISNEPFEYGTPIYSISIEEGIDSMGTIYSTNWRK